MDEQTIDGIEPSPARFWSPWATVGWGLVVMAVYIVVQILVAIVLTSAA